MDKRVESRTGEGRVRVRVRTSSRTSVASVISASLCLLIVSPPFLTVDCTRAVHYVAPEECQWSTIDGRATNIGSDSLVASSMTSSNNNDGEIDGDVSLVCRLKTLNGVFDRTNFSLIQPEHTASLTLRCDDLLFESTLADGSFRHLGRSLRALVLDRCKVGSIPAGAFAGLERLRNLTIRTRNGDWGGSVHALRLHEASLRSVPRLRRLDLSENGARRFPAKLLCGLGELRFVNLSDNTLENAAGLPFGYGIQQGSRQSLPGVATSDMSDVKENKNCPLDIEHVELARNRLRVLVDRGFASLQRLKTLDLRLNLIARAEEQALAGLRQLQVLDLSGNQLVALPPSFFRPCASKLTEIRIANNSVSVLPPGLFSGLENLIVLDASRNELTSHWLSGGDLFADLRSLAVLDLSYNRLTRLDSSTLKALTSLQVLQIHHNEIEMIADGAFASLQSLHALSLGHNRLKRLSSMSLTGPTMLGSLQLDDNALEEIDEQTFANCCQDQLMELNLSANRLRKVPRALAALQGLRSLDLGENEIEELVMATGKANAKEQQSNEASKFGPLQGLQNLYSLRLQGNFLGNLSRGVFRDMPSLRILNLARNRIGAVEQGTFDDVPELHALRLDANYLSDINGLFGNLHDLLMLNVSANRVAWFDYALVPLGLQWLDLHDNRVEGLGNYFELDGALKLRTLDASRNRITDIDASSLPDGIEIVFLGDNRIEKVKTFSFVGKQNLTRVDLSRNKLSTLDVNSLRLSEVPSRRPLPEFSLAGNPFLCDCHLEWLQRLAIGALGEARLYPRLVDADKLECRLTFSRGGLLGAITSKELASGSTDEEEDRGVASVSLAKAKPSQFLCRYKSHCFALCHCCDYDACDCKMVCPENCACFYDQSWNANVVDCSSRNHSQVPERVPMDVTELYLDGNDIPTLSSHAFIGRKNLRVLHLNGSGVQTIRNQTFNGLRALEVLQLARNYLVTLQGHEFERLVELRELDLSRNRITSLANGSFTSLKSLQLLRLDHNFLSKFELWQLDANLATLRHLRAAHNPWSCRCSFARRLADWLKARDQHGPPGMVVDTRSFQCLYNASSTAPLFLDPRNTTPGSVILPFCAKDREESVEAPLEIGVVSNSGGGNIISADGTEEIQDDTGSSATSTTTFVERLHSPELVPVLIVLGSVIGLIFLILALAIAYRRQVSVWMFAKYGVRLGSSPALASKSSGNGVMDDDDDEKLFDAFVSYSKKDEAFVSQILAPELECGDPPYRLCLHYRDLPVDNSNGVGPTTPHHHLSTRGIPIPTANGSSGTVSEALSEAMESSRRTVIVLSENFLRGEWGHYEFKAAHLEALAQQRTRAEPGRGGKKKRKRNSGESRLVLVIIILGRVSRSEVDADLRAWLERHPVLRWGERHFWEKLRYALPDVRRRRRRHPHQQLPPPPRHLNPSPPVPPSFQHHLYQTLNPPPPQASPQQPPRQGPYSPAAVSAPGPHGIPPPSSLPSHHQTQFYPVPAKSSFHPHQEIRQTMPGPPPPQQWHSLQKNERRQDVAVHM